MYSKRYTSCQWGKAYAIRLGMAKAPKTPVSVRLSTEELELLERVAERHGGNKTKAIVESLQLREAKREMTKEQLIAELTRRLK